MDARHLLRQMIEQNGSVLYLHVGSPPTARIGGQLVKFAGESFTPVSVKQTVYKLLKPRQRSVFEQALKLDFAYSVPGLSRFRASLALHRGAIAAQFTRIPAELPTLDSIAAPPVLTLLCESASGLLVVGGPAGSGKSTTMAAMIHEINAKRQCTINTIEEPIEFLHTPLASMVGQQEVGSDTTSFHDAIAQLGHVRPDVIMLGRVPEAQVLSDALVLAERGRLVLLPVRARGVEGALQQLLEYYPVDQRSQMRDQIAHVIAAVVSQVLLPRADGKGVVPAFEVLVANAAARDAVRADRPGELTEIMATGHELGMTTLDQALQKLAGAGAIATADLALLERGPLSSLR